MTVEASARAGESALDAEVARLREEVKALVRTESRLNSARSQLDVQMRLFRGLYELSQRNNARFDLRSIIEDIIHFAVYDLSYQRAVVLLNNARPDCYTTLAFDGYFDDVDLARIAQVSLDSADPLIAALRVSKQVVSRGEDRGTSCFSETAAKLGLYDFLAFPVLGGEEIIGLLVAGNTLEDAPSFAEVGGKGEAGYGLATLATQISEAVNKCRLFQALAEERNRLDENVRQRTRELSEAYANLSKLDNLKTQFFANVSHELRTPLTLSIGPLEEMLQRGREMSAGDRDQYLRTIYNNQLRLLKLINNLLDFAKLDARKVTMSFQRQDIVQALRFYLSTFASAARTRNLQMDITVEAEKVEIYVDQDKFEKIVVNLLSNAFKFTPDAGRISIVVRDFEQCIEIDVSDTGIGIPSANIDRIFERFSQVDSSEKRRYEGTGIGLAMVKEYITLHGGDVRVRSELGVGTTFTVTFPKGKEHLDHGQVTSIAPNEMTQLEPHQLADLLSMGTDEQRQEGSPIEPALPATVEQAPATTEAEPRAAARAASPSGAGFVLVVDDLPEMRQFVSSVLRRGGYRTTTARDGREGLEAARKLMPDIVVSDVMMPNMTGYELCEAVKKEGGALGRTPVILLSAKAEMSGKLQGLARGADDYLVKPFSADELLSRTANLIRLRRQERELASTLQALEEKDETIRRDLEDARAFQNSILAAPPAMSDLDIEVVYRPLGAVGGDLYDFHPLSPSRLRIFLADATGHGVQAAFQTMVIKSEYETAKHAATDADVLTLLNNRIVTRYGPATVFFTAICMTLDRENDTLTCAAGAHPAALRHDRSSDSWREIEVIGGFLGGRKDLEFKQVTQSFEPGDSVYLFSDGALEEHNEAGEMFGSARLTAALRAAWQKGASVGEEVESALLSFVGPAQRTDDLALIAIKRDDPA